MPKTRAAASKKKSQSATCTTHALGGASETLAPPTLPSDAMQRAQSLVDEFDAVIDKTVTDGDTESYRLAAQSMEKYLRNKFKLYGLKAPERRILQLTWQSSHREELNNRNIMLAILCCLWEKEKREMQAFGCDLAQEYRHLIQGADEEEFKVTIACIKYLLTTKSWWDTVDAIAYPVVGYYVKTVPEWALPVVNQWINDGNMWLRRVAILHQLQFKEDTNQERLFQYCLARAHEEEFFIRKAIGWALRQYARTNPAAVSKFVKDNRGMLSSLSIKEALKHIN